MRLAAKTKGTNACQARASLPLYSLDATWRTRDPQRSAGATLMKPRSFELQDYPTRTDEFRRRENLRIEEWAEASEMSRTALQRCRSGRDYRVSTLAKLVRGARQLTAKPILASEIADVGEDEPLPEKRQYTRIRYRVAATSKLRKRYNTALDRMLFAEGIRPVDFAREAGMSRQNLRQLRNGSEEPRISSVAKVVSTARRLTAKPYRAADFWDVGEKQL